MSLNSFQDFVLKKSQHKYFVYFLAFLLLLISFIFSDCYFLNFLNQNKFSGAWETIILKSRDLTNPLKHITAYSWQSKKVFRITVPFLMKIFLLTPSFIIKLQIITGYFFYLLSYKLSLRLFRNPLNATLFTITLSFLYIGKASVFEYLYTWFDGFSFFFLLAAMYYRKYYLIFLFSSLAAWNDERALIALSFVFLFHFQVNKRNNIVLKDFIKLEKNSIVVLAAILCYIILRVFLSIKFHLFTPTAGANLEVFFNHKFIHCISGIVTFFEGFYTLLFFYFFYLIKNKDYNRLLINIIPLLTISLTSLCVTDITRSGSFGFPLIFVSIQYLNHTIASSKLTKILSLSLIISLIIPPLFICTDWDYSVMLPKIYNQLLRIF